MLNFRTLLFTPLTLVGFTVGCVSAPFFERSQVYQFFSVDVRIHDNRVE